MSEQPGADHDPAKLLEAAFDAYVDAIFRYICIQTRDRDLSKDLTQETFIRYWQYLQRGEAVEHERAMLYRIAGNLVIDHVRRKKTVSLDALLEQGFEPGHDALHETHNRMELSRALQYLHRLPADYRRVLTLRFVDGLEPAEIADVLGETSNVISVRIHRGLKQLQSLMNRA